MKRFLFIVFLISACAPMHRWTITDRNEHIITGKITIQRLAASDSFPWYNRNYEQYTPTDTAALSYIKAHHGGLKVIIYGGTWCEDTQILLPKFMKVITMAGVKENQVKLYMVDRNKKMPDSIKTAYPVGPIPAFHIIYNGRDVGSIIETVSGPVESALYMLIK